MGMIPERLHFIFGLTPDFGGKPFSFVHWAAIRSAQLANPGWHTTVWTAHEPTGQYWEAIRPYVEVRSIEPPTEVFGNPIPHVAHKCDWLRLQVLYEHGGIYLDCDTITVKSFAGMLGDECTLITEFANGQIVGLCNAFIAAAPYCQFIADWIYKFRDFRSKGHDEYWNESAVKWPHTIWRKGGDACLRPSYAFMEPDWTVPGLEAMFERDERFPDAWGHHLWESFSWMPYLRHYTPDNYRDFNCTYSRLLHETLGREIESLRSVAVAS